MNNPQPTNESVKSPIVRIGKDTTVRWQCAAGDLVAWVPCAPFDGSGNEFKIADIWETRDGDSIVISNRPQDFPSWFQLAPSEVSGRNAYEMVEKLNRREIEAAEPMQAANVWRLTAGARLLWMGVKRPSHPTFERGQGVLQLLDFHENALVVGESQSLGSAAFAQFGALTTRAPSPEVGEMLGAARKLVRQLGMPRVMAVDWAIE